MVILYFKLQATFLPIIMKLIQEDITSHLQKVSFLIWEENRYVCLSLRCMWWVILSVNWTWWHRIFFLEKNKTQYTVVVCVCVPKNVIYEQFNAINSNECLEPSWRESNHRICSKFLDKWDNFFADFVVNTECCVFYSNLNIFQWYKWDSNKLVHIKFVMFGPHGFPSNLFHI